ncbi:zinc ribbon domain-containing protein [Idiomarina loihiensis]|uniref:zinc ribbon domain-containing protein n=1 Tax=Idiomarina loihiensis TaxID=135577 RepID=UPI00384E7DB5
MALINCPECDKKVSSKAATCPNCGVSISPNVEREEHEKKLTTTQLTAKSLKLQGLISLVIVIVGFYIIITGDASDESTSIWPPLITFLALVWWVITRIRIWWNHK